jgi:hypothetical protein
MRGKTFLWVACLFLSCGVCRAQKKNVALPESLVIARDTFWDFGPPFNYYDLIQIKPDSDGLAVDQVLVTPPGMACVQPATVEVRSVTLHESMEQLLAGRNPCAIPEKELHKEIKRCKKCLVFSGVHLTMQATCDGKDRQLNMDILDRDIYDKKTQTPANTSWSMGLLSHLKDSLGPGSEDKPMFPTGSATHHDVPVTPLVAALQAGQFDVLFGARQPISNIVLDAEKAPPPPPSVVIENVAPASPISPEILTYPPIAMAAHVDGLVTLTFDISPHGLVQNVTVTAGPKLVQARFGEAMSKWRFPQSTWGSSGRASIRLSLNCEAGPS